MLFSKRTWLIIQKIILVIILFDFTKTQAQIKDISLSKEVNIDTFYVGLLSYTGFNTTIDSNKLSSAQLGSRVQLTLVPKKIMVRAFGVIKLTEGQENQFFKSYETIFSPTERIAIHLGVMATPTTELRPNPTTWQSQVETNTESNLIGGRPGIKIKYKFNKQLELTYGLHNHDHHIASHLKVTYKQLTITSYLSDSNWFFATKWKYPNGNFIITHINKRVSVSSIIPMSTNYKFLIDLEHSYSTQELIYSEIGLRRYFSRDNFIKGFLSLNYQHHTKTIQGGLFIHI